MVNRTSCLIKIKVFIHQNTIKKYIYNLDFMRMTPEHESNKQNNEPKRIKASILTNFTISVVAAGISETGIIFFMFYNTLKRRLEPVDYFLPSYKKQK